MNVPEPFVLSRAQSRAIDAAAISELGLSGLLLMENAARGVCDVLLQEFCTDHRRTTCSTPPCAGQLQTTIVCGPGNNGGDGLALARQLAACGWQSQVQLFRCGRQLSSDSESNLKFLTASGIPVDDLSRVPRDYLQHCENDHVIVDCLCGTGVRGAPRGDFAQIIDAINAAAGRVVAVDVPSGLDCDTGLTPGACVRADRTVTFVGMKAGYASPSAESFLGTVSVAHIGIPRNWVRQFLQRSCSD